MSIRPRVRIISTGSEILAPGKSLRPGHIYDSNGYSLTGLAASRGADADAPADAELPPDPCADGNPADCDGPHDECVGGWICAEGGCVWECAPLPCASPRSYCQDDSDCPAGATCGPIPDDPRAPCVCTSPRPPVRINYCRAGPEPGDCCLDMDCPERDGRPGFCQAAEFDVQNAYCEAFAPPEWNRCAYDECLSDDECGPHGACVPPGAWSHALASCVMVACRSDRDCQRRPGGECWPFLRRCFSYGFACTYDGDPCRRDRNCPQDGPFPMYCAPLLGGHGTECLEDVSGP